MFKLVSDKTSGAENYKKKFMSWDVQFHDKHLQLKHPGIISIEVLSKTPLQGVSNFDFNSDLSDDDNVIVKFCDHPIQAEETKENNSNGEFTNDESQSLLSGLIGNISHGYRSITGDDSESSSDPRYIARLQDVELLKTETNKCKIMIHGDQEDKKLRLFFTNSTEAESFSNSFQLLNSAILKRANAFIQRHNMNQDSVKTFLLQIISAYNIKASSGSDPYCVVRIAKEIHRTEVIKNTIDPVWTSSTGSLVLFTSSSLDLGTFGLTFKIFDSAMISKDSLLGQAQISFETLLTSANQRSVVDLETNVANVTEKGKMVFKFREATEEDKEFMKTGKDYFNNILKGSNLQLPKNFNSPITESDDSNSRETDLDETGETIYRVSPYPDPKRPNETTWMTQGAIESVSMQPSKSWIQGGMGKLGKLFVEVIGCDNLHDDSYIDVIDPFLTIIFEGTCMCSEVVKDCASPRFMPWTRRAFMFNITYSTSSLYLGVHDYNKRLSDTRSGRVTIDLDKFRPNTEYLLYYDLNQSARFYPRSFRGTIKLRMSIEWHNQRELFYNEFQSFSHRFSCDFDSSKKMKIASFAVDGDPDSQNYSTAIVESLIEEMLGYANKLLEIPDAIINTAFWRTNPLNSTLLFVGGILFVEKPQLIPSLLAFLVGWNMLSRLGSKRDKSSQWQMPHSYRELVLMLLLGNLSPIAIEANNSHLFSDRAKNEKEQSIQDAINKQKEQLNSKLSPQNGALVEDQDYDNLTTKQKDLLPSPFEYILFPLQQLLQSICWPIRYLSKVINWERSIVSFWITTVSFFLCIIFIFVPWSFLIKWVARIVVWTFLGPWMILFDKAIQEYVSNKESYNIKQANLQIREHHENYLQLKDFRKILFGKYILSLPSNLQPDRYSDSPLSKSSAKVFPEEKVMSKEVGEPIQVLGYNLEMDMIPYLPYLKKQKQKHNDNVEDVNPDDISEIE